MRKMRGKPAGKSEAISAIPSRRMRGKSSILEIAERDRERFMTEISNPKAPGKALKEAAMQFRNTFETK